MPAFPPPNQLHHFYKYHALGNDMIVVDPTQFPTPMTPASVAKMCARHTGIGADGLCYGPIENHELPTMIFFNPDGSVAEKSGNGLRIFARYLWEYHLNFATSFQVGIGDEQINVEVMTPSGDQIRLGLGQASHQSNVRVTLPNNNQILLAVIDVSNPHAVWIIDAAIDRETLKKTLIESGETIENDAHFPNKTNVEFVRIVDEHTIMVEIWERSAGYTLASGTCSTAAAFATIHQGLCTSPIIVKMAGGDAKIEVDENGFVWHTSEVEGVYAGIFTHPFVTHQ